MKSENLWKSNCIFLTSLLLFSLLVFCSLISSEPARANIPEDPTPSQKYWEAFRSQNPLFVQDIVASSRDRSGAQLLLITEPPPLLFGAIEDTLKRVFGEAYKGHELFQQKIGFDGWTKDIVVRLEYPHDDQAGFEAGILDLYRELFGTDYRAGYRQFDVKPWSLQTSLKRKNQAPPNLRVSALSIYSWFFENATQLQERTAAASGLRSQSSTPVTLTQVFDSKKAGVYYSVEPGLVVLLVNRHETLNIAKPHLRQFFLDTDAIVGAVSPKSTQRNFLAIIGRERNSSISDMPPLRVETVLTLAATHEVDLAQSYERFHPLANKSNAQELINFVIPELSKIKSELLAKDTNQTESEEDRAQSQDIAELLELLTMELETADWAPILLSRDLMHTEYGNLLNVTDQLLKGWSMSNQVIYGNFPYAAPFEFPYEQGILEHLQSERPVDSLTFNWNTAGFGSWIPFEDFNIFTLYRTGSLPVSYIPDETTTRESEGDEERLINAEDTYWEFFSGLRDPNLNRAAQYAALHVMFQEYNTIADREEPELSYSKYKNRWKALENESLNALQVYEQNKYLSISEISEKLDGHQCLQEDPARYSESEWSEKKYLIDSQIDSFLASGGYSINDLARYLSDSRSYTVSIWDAYDLKRANLIAAEDQLDERIDSFNKDLDYCQTLSSIGSQTGQKTLEQRMMEEYVNEFLRSQSNLYNPGFTGDQTIISPVASNSSDLIKQLQLNLNKPQKPKFGGADLLRCNDLEIRRTRIEKENHRFTALYAEVTELDKHLSSLRSPDLKLPVRMFGDCNEAWRGIVDEQRDYSAGFNKTPSIVVSRYAIGYGGHNLDGRSIKVVPTDKVRKGNFRYDAEKDILYINPKDNANSGYAARSFERLRRKYLSGSPAYKSKVDNRIRAALNVPIEPAKPMNEALYVQLSRGRAFGGFGNPSRDVDRMILGGNVKNLPGNERETVTRLANSAEANIVLQKVGGKHRVTYVGEKADDFIAIESRSPADFQRSVENIVDHATRKAASKDGKVEIVSDSSVSWNDMESIYLSANARQAAIAESGGGGNRNFINMFRTGAGGGGRKGNGGSNFFKGKDNSALRILFKERQAREPILSRTDAIWSGAEIKSGKILGKTNGGTAILKLEVPFAKKQTETVARKLILRISAFFKREVSQKDLDTVSEVTFKTLSEDMPSSTVTDRIVKIRENYRARVGDDAELLFRLREGLQDLHIVDTEYMDSENG